MLTGDNLIKYNRVGGGTPRTPQLGDLLNAAGGDSRLLTAGTYDFYVETTGSDTDGDGLMTGTAFRQPQTAVNQIPRNAPFGVKVRVFCGSGSFEQPDVSQVPSNVRLEIYGDRTTPLVSAAAGAVSFSAVSGKNAQLTGNVGAYDGVASDGDAWLFADFSSFLPGFDLAPVASVAWASTAPNLVVVADSSPGSGALALYAFSTVFVPPDPSRTSMVCNTGVSNAQSTSTDTGVYLYGIDFTIAASLAVTYEGLSLQGCRWRPVSGSGQQVWFVDCEVSGYFGSNIEAVMIGRASNFRGPGCRFEGVLAERRVVISGSVDSKAFVSKSGSTAQLVLGNNVAANDMGGAMGFLNIQLFGGIDFEGTAPCILPLNGDISQRGDISIANNPSAFITAPAAGGLRRYSRVNGTVDGVVTGDAVTLVNGGQALGIKAACDGNLTSSGGNEIVVGGNAGAAFSTLPANDSAAGSPQFCRAT